MPAPLRLLAVSLLAAAAVACGGDAQPPPQHPPPYRISGGTLWCDGASARTNDPGPPRVGTCTWACIPYGTQEQRYVTLTFGYDGATWRLVGEYVTAGLC